MYCFCHVQNFVGLSVADDGYIACGSENNSVRSLPGTAMCDCLLHAARLNVVAVLCGQPVH